MLITQEHVQVRNCVNNCNNNCIDSKTTRVEQSRKSVEVDTSGWLCDYCRQSDMWCKCLCYSDDEDLTWPFVDVLEPQSGLETNADGTTNDNSVMRVSGTQSQENVKFADQVDPYLYDVDSEMDPTRMLQDSSDAELGNFFQRPIKIAEEEWATSTQLAFDINPWSLYFENPRVANRIANFNLLRCKLHVKVVINGNGFQYGRAIASYLPFASLDFLSSNAALIREDLVQASQQPKIFLDPTTSQGGEMILPFFNYYNYINIVEDQWKEMGQLFFRSINDLKHANGATDVVTVSVFAWAEDVSLSVLTSAETNTLTPQAGEIDEVNAKGTISGPATAIGKVAGAMTKIPMIGRFASATEMMANTTASIAKMFGYCRPPVTKNPEPYKPYPNSSLALTNVGDGPQKLTIDDKQELTVDPRIAGLGGVDSMNIKEIAKRESYLTTFSWNLGQSPETLLWNARIDPATHAVNAGSPTSFHFPACAMASLPFKFWTGTMRFRFQIVCSSFHKGRLKVVYDPNYFASNEYNTNYLHVIDIADQQDFTVEIANGQAVSLLTRGRPGQDSITEFYSTTPYTAPASFGNGVIGVYVVNELTTPNSDINNDIEVNVYVSMGDDFEVFVPDDWYQYFTFKPIGAARTPAQIEQDVDPTSVDEFPPLENQSGQLDAGTLAPESQNTNEPSAPQHDEALTLGPTMSDNSDLNKVFTGESIASFRTMLKRYNLWASLPVLSNQDTVLAGRYSVYPYLRGSVAGAIEQTAAGQPYNYCNTVLIHWVTNAFQGWRGSIRYKWLPRGTLNNQVRHNMYVQRHPIGETEFFRESNANVPYSSYEEAGFAIMNGASVLQGSQQYFSGAKGQAYQNGFLNPAIEFELPYYSPFRFTPGKEENHTGLNIYNEGYDYRVRIRGDSSTTFDIHVAAGEDFQTYFFTGLPRMYYEPGVPSPPQN